MEYRVVGLLTDPDLPTEIAEGIVENLGEVLSRSVSDQVDWDIRIYSAALPLDEYGKIIVWRSSERIKRQQGWDMMVCLTELTRRLHEELVISEVHIGHQAAVVCLPALGAFRLKHHTTNAIIRVLREMVEDDLQPDREVSRFAGPRWISPKLQAPVREETINAEGGRSSYLALKGLRGRVRLLSGMVRINRPWRMVPSLSSAIAAAAAAAAFGIFYSSIWSMADALSPARLLAISIISIGTMVAWLIFYNNLWEKPISHRMGRDALLYNSATIATLIVGVACIYVLLFLGALVAAITVIPAQYLETTLRHPVSWWAYPQLAWLATSMGTVAGALGSSFESDTAIREATYGRREQERHEKISQEEEDRWTASSGDDDGDTEENRRGDEPDDR